HPLVFLKISWNLEVLVRDCARCRHLKIGRYGKNDIRRANLPSLGKLRDRRQISGITLWRVGVGPSDQSISFLVTEPSIVRKGTPWLGGVPGRHSALRHLLTYCSGPWPNLRVTEQRHRGDLARAMAPGAVLVKYWSDVFRERWCRRRSPVGQQRSRTEQYYDGQPTINQRSLLL